MGGSFQDVKSNWTVYSYYWNSLVPKIRWRTKKKGLCPDWNWFFATKFSSSANSKYSHSYCQCQWGAIFAFSAKIGLKSHHHHHHHIYLFTKWRHITRKKTATSFRYITKASKYAIPLKPIHKLAESKRYLVTWWGDSEGPKGHLSLLPPHQVKVKKAASRFSQSDTFYDKKFTQN